MKVYQAITILLSLIILPSLVLYNNDLLTKTNYPNYHCANRICMYCIDRQDIPIAPNSNLIIHDPHTKFNTISVNQKYTQFVTCQDLFQMVDHTAQHIKIEQSPSVQQFMHKLHIYYTVATHYWHNIQPIYLLNAVFQKLHSSQQPSLYYQYSPQQSCTTVQVTNKIITIGTFISCILLICYYLFDAGLQYCKTIICSLIFPIISINIIMVFSAFTTYTDVDLTQYAKSLFIITCVTVSRPHRLVVVCIIVLSYLLMSSLYQPFVFMGSLIIHLICWPKQNESFGNRSVKKYLTVILSACTLVQFVNIGGQEWIASPICRICLNTIVCTGSLLICLIDDGEEAKYEQVRVNNEVNTEDQIME